MNLLEFFILFLILCNSELNYLLELCVIKKSDTFYAMIFSSSNSEPKSINILNHMSINRNVKFNAQFIQIG
ncbi:hypothetical protein BpHYR1_046275 [Brachionus plicatilis]|uniref:Secreted protein n=1 Tax=Brachionus plicatilis TaxID=10195 RepID=A0A3M7PYL3_BRAPC|nr:hypothetical protein BpHYR1_046275 [Brachionus plicatilis]